jgi:hypothetical protein
MRTLSLKIVSKLSKDLGLSESTIKKNIYLLAKQYPHATKNALAQIYSLQNNKTIYRLLDKEDRSSLPVTNPVMIPTTQLNRRQIKKHTSRDLIKKTQKFPPEKGGLKKIYQRLHSWSETHQGILQLAGVFVGVVAVIIAILLAL